MQAVLVTGVSSGIGRAVLEVATQNGVHVFGSVRRAQDERRLSADFGDRVTPLRFDVRDEGAIAAAANRVSGILAGEPLLGLINNAGVGLAGPVLHQPMDEIRAVIDTNLLGPILVTRAFAPLLGATQSRKSRKGRVVNISSIAGKVGQPFAAAYAASKHGLEGLSEVMRRELALYGIPVIVVAPATVSTPIWNEPEAAIGRYDATDFDEAFNAGVRAIVDAGRQHGLDPRKVAETVWLALTAKRPRIRYSPAQHPLLEQALPRVTPSRLADVAVEHSLGLKPKAPARSGLEP